MSTVRRRFPGNTLEQLKRQTQIRTKSTAYTWKHPGTTQKTDLNTYQEHCKEVPYLHLETPWNNSKDRPKYVPRALLTPGNTLEQLKRQTQIRTKSTAYTWKHPGTTQKTDLNTYQEHCKEEVPWKHPGTTQKTDLNTYQEHCKEEVPWKHPGTTQKTDLNTYQEHCKEEVPWKHPGTTQKTDLNTYQEHVKEEVP